jgi:hypothetical protein
LVFSSGCPFWPFRRFFTGPSCGKPRAERAIFPACPDHPGFFAHSIIIVEKHLINNNTIVILFAQNKDYCFFFDPEKRQENDKNQRHAHRNGFFFHKKS